MACDNTTIRLPNKLLSIKTKRQLLIRMVGMVYIKHVYCSLLTGIDISKFSLILIETSAFWLTYHETDNRSLCLYLFPSIPFHDSAYYSRTYLICFRSINSIHSGFAFASNAFVVFIPMCGDGQQNFWPKAFLCRRI